MTPSLKIRAFLFVLLGLGTLLVTVYANAQPHFNHIIIAIQENRTPDNLFSGCSLPAADVQQNGGSPIALAGGKDYGHVHTSFLRQSSGKWPAGSNNYIDARYIEPYCQLASEYGFANRFFQTNQGPSFPAHQFLISGSSSPDDDSDLLFSGERVGPVIPRAMMENWFSLALTAVHFLTCLIRRVSAGGTTQPD